MSQILDRLIRVRRIRARQAMADLARAQAAARESRALIARLAALRHGALPGVQAVAAARARWAADATLARLADDLTGRLAAREAAVADAAARLARAQAAVDAAITRRANWEEST
jgi:hypothetical protein